MGVEQGGQHPDGRSDIGETVEDLFTDKPEDLALVFTVDKLRTLARESYDRAAEEQKVIDKLERELFAARTRKRVHHSRGYTLMEAAELAKAHESLD